MIIFIWFILLSIFVGSYVIYFSFLKYSAEKDWTFKINTNYTPNITILVPAYNEEKNIYQKLENLQDLDYPQEKMEIIIIDDASTDQTLKKVYEYINTHQEFPITIFEQNPRAGKASALNKGLNISSNNIIVVTDADSLCPKDILRKAIPYVSAPEIGALTGRGVVNQLEESWATKSEESYLDFINLLRLGESKIHSTIRFEGCFCIFKKDAFSQFDDETGADDSGTALRVIQNGYRAILVPDVFAYIESPVEFTNRIKVKMRRAIHLNGLWFGLYIF